MLDVLLKVHRDQEDIDFDSMWESGLFVFDSNVLLDIYRLPESASNDLINVLKDDQLSQRIWIGFQVLVEFLNNRHDTISDQKNKFNSVRTLLNEAMGQYDEVFKKLTEELAKLKLKQRHSLIDPDKFITPISIASGKSVIEEFLKELSDLEGVQSDVNDRDYIKDVVLKIFSGKIGSGFSGSELDAIYKEGAKRYEDNIPPGYKDIKKPGFYMVEERKLVRKYGDLILWKEIIRKAKDDEITSIVLVTGDVKEDWWLEKRGKKLGPRKELLNEIYTEAPCVKSFYMYDTAGFLKHAKSRLKTDVSESSITQVEHLMEINKKGEGLASADYVLLWDFFRQTYMPGLKIDISKSVRDLPLLNVNLNNFCLATFEIFRNVVDYGVGGCVYVDAVDGGGYVSLRFVNQVLPDAPLPMPHWDHNDQFPARATGVMYARSLMLEEGISSTYLRGVGDFTVYWDIPKSKFIEK